MSVYGIKQIKVYSEIPFSNNPYYIARNQSTEMKNKSIEVFLHDTRFY